MGELKGYQWPASALTVNEMEILTRIRKQESIPITQLLKKAIIVFDLKHKEKRGSK